MDLFRREIGALSTRSFSTRTAYSEDHIRRLRLWHSLKKCNCSLNSICFNDCGDSILTASDKRLVIWDFESGESKLSSRSPNRVRINATKFLPFSEDRSIISCGADGKVTHAQILEDGRVDYAFLGEHQGQACKLAVEPGSPFVFYTCGSDAMAMHVDLRCAPAARRLFTCTSMDFNGLKSRIPLTTIAVDPGNANLLAVAGEDPLARIYDIRKCNGNRSDGLKFIDSFRPPHISADATVSGLAFSDQRELLVSYIQDNVYLFSKDMGMGPAPRSAPATQPHDSAADGPTVFKGHNAAQPCGVNFLGPRYVASGSENGRIYIWKKKNGELVMVKDARSCRVIGIEAHPQITALACATDKFVRIWTPLRTKRAVLKDKAHTDQGQSQ